MRLETEREVMVQLSAVFAVWVCVRVLLCARCMKIETEMDKAAKCLSSPTVLEAHNAQS